MNLFDILGPVMVGPSSSHTAGAVRLGGRRAGLLGEARPRERRSRCSVLLRRPAADGTDRALIAGLLGFQPDDERIAEATHGPRGTA